MHLPAKLLQAGEDRLWLKGILTFSKVTLCPESIHEVAVCGAAQGTAVALLCPSTSVLQASLAVHFPGPAFSLACSEGGTPPCFVVGGVGSTGELPAPGLSQCPAQILPSSPFLPDPGSWKAEAKVPAPATLLPTHPLQCTHTVQLELPSSSGTRLRAGRVR